MKKSYQDMDIRILQFEAQDIVTFSETFGADAEDSATQGDVYSDQWWNGTK